MAKFRVTKDANYVMGHLRYGHLEGIIEADSLEDAKRKVREDEFLDNFNLLIDDYEVEDVDYSGNQFEYEEITEE